MGQIIIRGAFLLHYEFRHYIIFLCTPL